MRIKYASRAKPLVGFIISLDKNYIRQLELGGERAKVECFAGEEQKLT
jgi:hypothetical protein